MTHGANGYGWTTGFASVTQQNEQTGRDFDFVFVNRFNKENNSCEESL